MLTRLRKAIYRVKGHCPVTLGEETGLLGDPYHSKFWSLASSGAWEPETFDVLNKYLSKDTDYIDIGAWIGATVMFGSRKARHVWAFEPDPTAFRALSWNIDLNALTNVSALPVALSDAFGIARMASFRGEQGDSTTSLLNPTGKAGNDVVTVNWADFAACVDLARVSLVKIDIEGAEFSVLPTLLPWLQETRPALLLSTHAPYLPEGERRNKMSELVKALAFYPGFTDLADASLTREDALSDAALGKFQTYLFSG